MHAWELLKPLPWGTGWTLYGFTTNNNTKKAAWHPSLPLLTTFPLLSTRQSATDKFDRLKQPEQYNRQGCAQFCWKWLRKRCESHAALAGRRCLSPPRLWSPKHRAHNKPPKFGAAQLHRPHPCCNSLWMFPWMRSCDYHAVQSNSKQQRWPKKLFTEGLSATIPWLLVMEIFQKKGIQREISTGHSEPYNLCCAWTL